MNTIATFCLEYRSRAPLAKENNALALLFSAPKGGTTSGDLNFFHLLSSSCFLNSCQRLACIG